MSFNPTSRVTICLDRQKHAHDRGRIILNLKAAIAIRDDFLCEHTNHCGSRFADRRSNHVVQTAKDRRIVDCDQKSRLLITTVRLRQSCVHDVHQHLLRDRLILILSPITSTIRNDFSYIFHIHVTSGDHVQVVCIFESYSIESCLIYYRMANWLGGVHEKVYHDLCISFIARFSIVFLYELVSAQGAGALSNGYTCRSDIPEFSGKSVIFGPDRLDGICRSGGSGRNPKSRG